jgi:hypothetical protein
LLKSANLRVVNGQADCVVDTETGQVKGDLVDYKTVLVKEYPKRQGQWFEMQQEDLSWLLEPCLQRRELRMLIACLKKMSLDNEVKVKQVDLAALCKIPACEASRAIRNLKQLGFLIERYDEMGAKCLFVSSLVGWKGAQEKLAKQRARDRDHHLALMVERCSAEHPELGHVARATATSQQQGKNKVS